MGDKVMARKKIAGEGIPVIPGSMDAVNDEDGVVDIAEKVGYPILIKAVFGGGGKGMRIINSKNDVHQAFEIVKLEAKTSFGKSDVYVEKLLLNPRHIEFQILADKEGNILHLNERECSIQRKHQKLIEETPSPMMTEETRVRMGKAAVQVAGAVNYTNAGTVEFMIDETGNYYFLEMNTRIQVEHLITEMVTGIDIVKEQIKISLNENMKYKQEDIGIWGHAIDCRINAEDPTKDFLPSPGVVASYHLPGGPGIRVDSALYAGYKIPVFYDSLIAKLAVWGVDRNEAILRMKNALDEFIIEGVKTTIPYHKKILEDDYFKKGKIHTGFIHERMKDFDIYEGNYEEIAAITAAISTYLNDKKEGSVVIPLRRNEKQMTWKRIGIENIMKSRELKKGVYSKRI
jgi:acetyl-CoA carboxylase biotin carboxylase subunit